MANGGSNPLQGFIETHMQIQAMQEASRQAEMQETLAIRQMENQEIGLFTELLSRVQRPEEAEGLTGFFATRNPEMTGTFEALMQNFLPSIEQQMAGSVLRGAQAGASPEDRAANLRALTGMTPAEFARNQVAAGRDPETWEAVLAIEEGRALSLPQMAQLQLAWSQHGLDQDKFHESIRQFGIDEGLRRIALQLQSRGLDIQATEVAQRIPIAKLQYTTAAGLLPFTLMSENSQRILELEQQLQMPLISPRAKAALEHEIADIQRTNEILNEFWESQWARDHGLGPDMQTLAPMFNAHEAAWRQVNTAKNRGELEAAHDRFNIITQLIGTMTGETMNMLERRQGLGTPFADFFSPARPGASQAVPFTPPPR